MVDFLTKNILSYNVIIYIMSEVFEAKIRRIGNSFGLIVPAHIIEEMNFHKGDVVQVVIPHLKNRKRNKLLFEFAGIDKNKTKFKREKEDRF